jgi:transcription elongation GreA/GreB family factor
MNTTITKKAPILLSKKGMKELRKSIHQLEHDRSMAIKGLREIDRSLGHDARLERIERLARLESIETELHEKHQLLSNAQLLPSRRARMKVAIGSVVDLIDQQGQLFRYTLVDTVEANPSDGRISVISPLGQSLIGKTAQDSVEWRAGVRQNKLQLVRIN